MVDLLDKDFNTTSSRRLSELQEGMGQPRKQSEQIEMSIKDRKPRWTQRNNGSEKYNNYNEKNR